MLVVTNLVVVPDAFVSHWIHVLSINRQQDQLPLQWLPLQAVRRLFANKICLL